jgi:3-deoxy-D-manno-octulosonic-acid transferase
LIGASTHEGEESQLLDLYQQLKRVLPELLLVLVPRHPERFRPVSQLVGRRGLKVARRSKGDACSLDTDVYLGDTMGELLIMYQASDVVFVGGSLVGHGGHNPMEPAALAKPILTGPHTFNFSEIMKMMVDAGSVQQIKNSIELMAGVETLFSDAALYQRMSKAGIDVVKKNQGALNYLLELVDSELKR